MRKGLGTWILALPTLLVSVLLLSSCLKREAVKESPVALGQEAKTRPTAPALAERGPQAAQPGQPQPGALREERVAREKATESQIGEGRGSRADLGQERLGEEGPAGGARPGLAKEEVARADPAKGRMTPVPGTEVAAVPPPGVDSPWRVIYFDFDRYDLREESKKVLQEIADWMMKYPGVKLIIEGHSDERGTDQYNLALGERRAASALRYLQELGVSVDRLGMVSYGEMRPADPGHNEESWAKNRRDAFVITK